MLSWCGGLPSAGGLLLRAQRLNTDLQQAPVLPGLCGRSLEGSDTKALTPAWAEALPFADFAQVLSQGLCIFSMCLTSCQEHLLECSCLLHSKEQIHPKMISSTARARLGAYLDPLSSLDGCESPAFPVLVADLTPPFPMCQLGNNQPQCY